MKKTKIVTTLSTLYLALFMSMSSMANSYTGQTGDNVKTNFKDHISTGTNTVEAASSVASSNNDFNHLRFDVNKFMNTSDIEISELPASVEFDYLRFDVNNFIEGNSNDQIEVPVNEFDYLRFDIKKFEGENTVSTMEFPAE